MTELTQLAREYLAEAANLKQRMERLKEELKTAGCSESCEINRRLAILYTMYLECRHVGNLLTEHPAAQRERKEADAYGKTAEL